LNLSRTLSGGGGFLRSLQKDGGCPKHTNPDLWSSITRHVIPALSRNLRQNSAQQKRDARLHRGAQVPERDKQTCNNKFHTYSALLLSCCMWLPIFRPNGEFTLGFKIENFFILLLKEVAFCAVCKKTEDVPSTQILTFGHP